MSLESAPCSGAFGKDARATCDAGTSTRGTCGDAKHTSAYLNRELHSRFKLNWTLGTGAETFVRLLLPVPACFAASEENEQCSRSPLAGFSWHRAGQDPSTPLHNHMADTGAVTISSTQALVYTLLAALSLRSIFN